MQYESNGQIVELYDSRTVMDTEIVNDLKMSDPGYAVIYRTFTMTNGKRRKTKIEVYTSGGTGALIRDAITGNVADYKHKVGSKYEDLYFKVSIATGECMSENGSNVLFYESPEAYTKQFLDTTVSSNVIQKWEDKYNRIFDELTKHTVCEGDNDLNYDDGMILYFKNYMCV